MEDVKIYEIPDNIRNIEFGADISKFNDLKKMIPESQSTESTYFEILSAMVFLEEAAHSRRVQKFDLENVRLQLHSRQRKMFAIEYDVR